MLVLTRRVGESFFVGDDIEIIILQTGSQIKIGVNAPSSVEVVRTELIPQQELEEVED